ncbi:hypothetical protein FK531_17840 [Rhodococcus spelaei]|uniref:Uncharacterized protein n=1 Tax=Rhodococcus spelaei TaxID=2546320 RepID=A0A541B2H0_9NOCA|nr:hypothetical protein [Rhodococcus spelaei]TQF66510.1 hypothetical protein FK531_17840 [Rhodococcus spelaei]
MIRPRLRGLAVVSVVLGALVAVVVGLFAPVTVAVLVGAIIAVPTALSALLAMRRRIWLSGTTVHSCTGIRTKSVNLSLALSAELVVRAARVSQVALRVGDNTRRVSVPLALYTADGGRELEVLALRSLADALVSGDLVPAVAMSDALIGQLRAEARGAGLEERPLFRAVQLAREASRVPETVLTDDEVVRLVG